MVVQTISTGTHVASPGYCSSHLKEFESFNGRQFLSDSYNQSLGREDPLGQGMEPTSVFLPGESHGQRSLAGCGP